MNWEHARNLAVDHQSSCRVASVPKPRRRRRARRRIGWALVDLGLRLAVGRPTFGLTDELMRRRPSTT
jgi:hypothetical protein